MADESKFSGPWVDRLLKLSILVIAAGVVFGIVMAFRESPRRMPPVLRELSEQVTDEFAEKLPRDRQVNDLLILVLQSGNRDEEKEFKNLLKQKVKQSGKYKISDWQDLKNSLSDTFWGKVVKEIPGMMPGDDPKNIAQAKKALAVISTTGKQIDGVLLVNVDDFDEGQEGYKARVTCSGEIYSVEKSATIDTLPPVTESVESRFNYIYLHHRIESTWFPYRAGLWLVIASTLPFVLISLVRGIVSKRKNEQNLMLVVGFTLFDVILGWILLCSISFNFSTGIVTLILVGAMGYYNFDACDYIERRLT